MSLQVVYGLDLKIQSFLQNVGVEFDETACSRTQLLRYFEDEFGLKLMPLLEQEWINEQLERDLTSGDFWHVDDFEDEDLRESFDEAVSSISDA